MSGELNPMVGHTIKSIYGKVGDNDLSFLSEDGAIFYFISSTRLL